MATVQPIKQKSPSEYVAEAVEQSENTMQASELLEQWAKKVPSLKAYLVEPWLPRACYEAVSRETRHVRDKVWTAPNYTKGGNGSRVIAHGKSLLDFPLPGGLLLRHAKKNDLEEAATFYREQAEDMMDKAKWLEAIAAKVGRKKVESVFSAEKLAALR